VILYITMFSHLINYKLCITFQQSHHIRIVSRQADRLSWLGLFEKSILLTFVWFI